MKQIKGILADIDGTLYFKGSPISGTIEAVEKLRNKGIKLLFFTNTDSKSPRTVFNTLNEYGFSLAAAIDVTNKPSRPINTYIFVLILNYAIVTIVSILMMTFFIFDDTYGLCIKYSATCLTISETSPL